MIHEGQHAAGYGVAGGLVAGHGQEHEEQVELQCGEFAAVAAGLDELGDDVVDGARPLAGAEPVGVLEHLQLRLLCGREAGAQVGVVRADEQVRPPEELVAVLLRDPHQVGDDDERQLCRAQGDEVTLASGEGFVDDALARLLHCAHEGCCGARGEPAVDEGTQPGVFGRVHVEHHQPLGLQHALVGFAEQRQSFTGGEHLGVAGDRDDVGVPGHGPEAFGELRVRVAVDGGLAAQPGEGRVGDAVFVGVGGEDVEVGERRGRGCVVWHVGVLR